MFKYEMIDSFKNLSCPIELAFFYNSNIITLSNNRWELANQNLRI
jgi:hypothetical protein